MLVAKKGGALPLALVAAPAVLTAINQGVELLNKFLNKKKKTAEDKAYEAAQRYAEFKLKKESGRGFYNNMLYNKYENFTQKPSFTQGQLI